MSTEARLSRPRDVAEDVGRLDDRERERPACALECADLGFDAAANVGVAGQLGADRVVEGADQDAARHPFLCCAREEARAGFHVAATKELPRRAVRRDAVVAARGVDQAFHAVERAVEIALFEVARDEAGAMRERAWGGGMSRHDPNAMPARKQRARRVVADQPRATDDENFHCGRFGYFFGRSSWTMRDAP